MHIYMRAHTWYHTAPAADLIVEVLFIYISVYWCEVMLAMVECLSILVLCFSLIVFQLLLWYSGNRAGTHSFPTYEATTQSDWLFCVRTSWLIWGPIGH